MAEADTRISDAAYELRGKMKVAWEAFNFIPLIIELENQFAAVSVERDALKKQKEDLRVLLRYCLETGLIQGTIELQDKIRETLVRCGART